MTRELIIINDEKVILHRKLNISYKLHQTKSTSSRYKSHPTIQNKSSKTIFHDKYKTNYIDYTLTINTNKIKRA